MENKILVETTIKYDKQDSYFYCLSGCKYHRHIHNNNEFVFATCLLFGDFFRYTLVPRHGRAPLRHKACIECDKISDMFGGGRNA